ncbi:MAG: DNA-packaging protein [Rhodobiaceae bacterium]|nr:DNA-packaging protein [Rhodobiaceae bacterium]MCC0042280.1 DNA-packaging protein [Rhodobiaceae bacterium]
MAADPISKRFAASLLSDLAAYARTGRVGPTLGLLGTAHLEAILRDWRFWARREQIPPPGEWTSWLILGGRGAGKTRSGAEFVRAMALGHPPYAPMPVSPIALVGETYDETRAVMVEGASGILGVHKWEERPVWSPTKRTLQWPNAGNLAPGFLRDVVGRYVGTRLGRQELDGELIDDRPDTLFPRAVVDANRVAKPPDDLRRIVVAVDPPASSSTLADACGIVAAGADGFGNAYVLEDASVQGASPAAWARRAIGLYRRLHADRIVAEVNQGGEMVEAVLRQVDADVPVRRVRATRGKWLRAEPVAALYEQGRVRHAGTFAELEDEMADFGPDGLSDGRSPDRLDALVWAITALIGPADPKIRRV